MRPKQSLCPQDEASLGLSPDGTGVMMVEVVTMAMTTKMQTMMLMMAMLTMMMLTMTAPTKVMMTMVVFGVRRNAAEALQLSQYCGL